MQKIKATLIVVWILSSSALHAQTGHVVHGVGAINQSMAGAGTALPLDATGALFWNPASITDLKSTEVDVNADLVLIDGELSSSVATNAFGPALPRRTLAGSSETTATKVFLAGVAWAHVETGQKWAYGILATQLGGFSFDYKNNGLNPITTPQPPSGFGVGEIFTYYSPIQVAPSLARRLNDRLSVAIAPEIDFAILKADPFPFTTPDDTNRDGFPTFPQSNRAHSAGGGVQGAVYYKTNDTWQLGLSAKSPQWFDAFEFHSRNELGAPRSFKFTLNYPMIVTAGVGYSGGTRVNWAADIRYIDYEDTKGFRERGFDLTTGAVRGLGWKSIWVFATGLQFRFSDRFSVRAGYGFNGNPIRPEDTFFNVGSPLITQHQSNVGFSYHVKEHTRVSFAYHHAFENEIRGNYQSFLGPIPGTSVQSNFGTNVLVLSLNRRF